MEGPFKVAELALRLGGDVDGDGSRELVDARGLGEAGPEHLSFLSNRRYVSQMKTTRAGAVLIDRQTDAYGHTVIRCDDPYVAFARALALYHPYEPPAPYIDPQAYVAPDAVVEGATVDAFAWIGSGAVVGRSSWVEAGAYVGQGARIGEGCRLMANSVVGSGCVLGDRIWLNPGAVIGGEGFGFAPSPEGHVKIPQTGRAVVEHDVEIGANSCVDRATMGETVVRRGAKLDNLVQVGHGAEIGEDALLAAYAGISGSTRLGKNVMMAGKSGTANHLEIGDAVQVAAASSVLSNQPDGAKVAGTPAIDHRTWLRAATAFEKLPELLARVRQFEKRLAELEAEIGSKK